MKFSQRKRAKVKKWRQAQVDRFCKGMIGKEFYCGQGYKVEDIGKINGFLNLLAIGDDGEHAIFKVIAPYNYVKLSPRKVSFLRNKFSENSNWQQHSTIKIAANGLIESVAYAPYYTLWVVI